MRGITLLMYASDYGHEQIVEMLLQRGATVDLQHNHGQSALSLAANKGREPIVEKLLQRGAAVDLQASNGFTALMYPAIFGHPTTVRRLLQAGASMGLRDKKHGMTALQWAKDKGHTECVRAFKDHL